MGNLYSRFENFLFSIRYNSDAFDDLTVVIEQGKLRGREFTSVLNHVEYYGFLGIPYAKPPVGKLRFQPPQKPEPWRGTYNAAYERSMCQQVTFVIWGKKFVSGSEDCLYLNVYTPQKPIYIETPKPVMVFIHGGGFCIGSGSRKAYSPDYLITRDIILVTINYRLLFFGFLNLGLPECPGNVGMKDQVLALKWVRENIRHFGGDPDNITIFGESAGSSSVHYHLLSPISRGLFHKAIMESGTALSPWGIIYNPYEQAMEFGKQCGYTGNDKRELFRYLMGVSAKTLTEAASDLIFVYRKIYPARFNNIGPSVEEISEEAFLPDWPENLAKIAKPLPTIFGVNNKEGMLIIMGVMSGMLVSKIREDFSIILKHNFKIDSSLVQEACNLIKSRYFGDKSVGWETIDEIVDLYSDIMFCYGYESIDFLVNSNTPPFIYEFSYNGPLNCIQRLVNFIKRTKIKGASHGDELFYLFYPQFVWMYPPLTGECLRKIEEMTLMWSNFAKTGNPSGEVEWKPSTSSEPCYLKIDTNSRMVQGKFYGERLEFFRSIIKNVVDPAAKPYDIFEYLYLINLLSR